jgi:hypothetical protein
LHKAQAQLIALKKAEEWSQKSKVKSQNWGVRSQESGVIIYHW